MRGIIPDILGRVVVWAFLIAFCTYVVRSWVRWSCAQVKLTAPRWRSGITTVGFGASTTSLTVINRHRRNWSTCSFHWWTAVLSPCPDARFPRRLLERFSRSVGFADRKGPAPSADNYLFS